MGIYYEANTIPNFYEAFWILNDKLFKNKFKNKNMFCNFRDQKVLGSDLKGPTTEVDRMYEILDHVETLAGKLKENHRTYKVIGEKQKNNVEAVHIKVELPYEICVLGDTKDVKARINSICKELIKELKPKGYTLPYYAIVIGEGNKHYLNILYIDRQLYKDGKKVTRYNKTTRYKFKKFISQEKAEELINQGYEVEMFAPGELEFNSEVEWSAKVTDNWFGPLSSLQAKRNGFISLIKQIFKSFNINLNEFKKRWLAHLPLNKAKDRLKRWQVVLYHKMYWYLYRKNIAINSLVDTLNVLNEDGHINTDEKKRYRKLMKYILSKRINAKEFELFIDDLRKEVLVLHHLDEDIVDEYANGRAGY